MPGVSPRPSLRRDAVGSRRPGRVLRRLLAEAEESVRCARGVRLELRALRTVGEQDLRGLLRRHVGVEDRRSAIGGDASDQLRRDDMPGADEGAMPAKVSENMRPMLMAGLAKLVELVKK